MAAAASALSAAERSHPTSEVRDSGREYQTAMVQEQPRGVTPHPRSGGAAERRYPASEVRGGDERSNPASEVRGSDERSYPASEVRGGGWEEIPHAPSPRPRAAAGRSNPTPEARGGGWEDQPHVQGAVAPWAQEGLEELSHVESHKGGGEEIPLIQGKEQRLHFPGAAMKRYPTSKIRETQVRW